MKHTRLVLAVAVSVSAATLACSPGGDSGGSGGASASGGSGSGSGGSSGGRGGAGAGGTSASGGSGGATGGSGAGGGGSGGSGGGPGSGGSTGGSGGSGGASGSGGSGGSAADAAGDTGGGPQADASADGAPASNRILFYTRTNGATHADGIATAVAEMTKLLGPAGLTSDTSNDPAVLTTANLARYAGVVLISTSGPAFGMPGTAQIEALTAFVRGGGGLAGFHAASNTTYPDDGPYSDLLGGAMRDQGGGFRTSDCYPEGQHPAVAKVTAAFRVVNEEFYTFNNLNAQNQVVLRCNAMAGTDRIPISWVREEGAGRIFYTGLGHYPALWMTGAFLPDHAWPGVLWTLKKP